MTAIHGLTVAAALLSGDARHAKLPRFSIDEIGTSIEIPEAIPDGTGFGCAVAANDGRVAVGIDGRRDGLKHPGTVIDFHFDGLRWVPDAILRSPESMAADEFGSSLSIDRGRMIVGSPGADGERGIAWCFTWSTTNGWSSPRPLRPNPIGTGDRFGDTVEISGDLALVGIPRDDVEGMIDAGRVDVFNVSPHRPTPIAGLQAEHPRTGARFGTSLAIGQNIAVGAIGADAMGPEDEPVDRAGNVQLFSTEPPFPRVATVGRELPGPRDRSGTAIDYHARTLIVGSPRARIGPDRSGVITIFGKDREEYLEPRHPDGGIGSSLVAFPPLLAFTVPGNRDESGQVDASIRICLLRRQLFIPILDVVGFGGAGTELILAADRRHHRLIVGAPGREEDGPYEGRAWTIDFEPSSIPAKISSASLGRTVR